MHLSWCFLLEKIKLNHEILYSILFSLMNPVHHHWYRLIGDSFVWYHHRTLNVKDIDIKSENPTSPNFVLDNTLKNSALKPDRHSAYSNRVLSSPAGEDVQWVVDRSWQRVERRNEEIDSRQQRSMRRRHILVSSSTMTIVWEWRVNRNETTDDKRFVYDWESPSVIILMDDGHLIKACRWNRYEEFFLYFRECRLSDLRSDKTPLNDIMKHMFLSLV